MPSKSPSISINQEKVLRVLGQQIREHRKRMKISAIVTAEAAGLSRVTLYRIEQGEPSVAIGAYISVISALGLVLELGSQKEQKQRQNLSSKKIPKKVRLADYKQLKRLAWQIKDSKEVSAQEALELYERNWRHLDIDSMDNREQKFLKALLAAFGRERLLV